MVSPRITVVTFVVFTLILPASRSFHLSPTSCHTSVFRPRAHPVCTLPAAAFQLRASASVESGDKAEDAPSGAVQPGLEGFIRAGPGTPPPSYAEDDERWFDKFAINLFRAGMVRAIGDEDVSTPGYPGLMELALKLNRRFPPGETRRRTRGILASFFTPFILKLFPVMFAIPLPAFSAKLNAAITAATCRWLMGPIEVVDVPAEELLAGWGDGVGQGLQVERCRFLEESGCASVCINTCKVPTQDFFVKDMGIPLTMEPNYETFECKFSFGKAPLKQASPFCKKINKLKPFWQ